MKKIKTVAIANRGEVAVRIITACRELGIKTVLLHSEVDVESIAYRLADECRCLGPAPSAESYLHIQKNVEAALSAGADAIHPGFGFLSENADFARAVEDAKMIFIGPTPEQIRTLGDKVRAKDLIEKANVPTVPGYRGEDQSLPTLLRECEKIGYPVIVKAAFGGGGRGMKVVREASSAKELVASAQREALSGFGSEKVFLEKYLDRAKHIEFQVFGDGAGRAVHLSERECSVQRRHQKIIEEALSPSLTPELREAMGSAAVRLAEAAKYRGAGTVEFLLQDQKYYFLEMNTRLQVEHPVTEMVLGIDLVRAQILLADGSFQLWDQKHLSPKGHSIECRVYAEDPYRGGMPSTGQLTGVAWPHGPGRRFEAGFAAGDSITPFYDPMVAKVIVYDETRELAIARMQKTLSECVVFGVRLNIPFLQAILAHPEFKNGTMTTQFIEQYFSDGLPPQVISSDVAEFAEWAVKNVRAENARSDAGESHLTASPFAEAWRNI